MPRKTWTLLTSVFRNELMRVMPCPRARQLSESAICFLINRSTHLSIGFVVRANNKQPAFSKRAENAVYDFRELLSRKVRRVQDVHGTHDVNQAREWRGSQKVVLDQLEPAVGLGKSYCLRTEQR